MPLPQALLDRLKKRGIILKEAANGPQFDQDQEEVIAEDYDDPKASGGSSSLLAKGLVVVGCPNKYNIYHDCNDYCQKKWGPGKSIPSPGAQRKYQKLLKRYPLPQGWQDVWEPGVACYYFWNTSNDEVSWFPPHHPKARVTVSAAKLKAMMKDEGLDEDMSDDEEEDVEDDDSEGDSDGQDSRSSHHSTSSGSGTHSDSEPEKMRKKVSPPARRLLSLPRVGLRNDRRDFRPRDRRPVAKRNDIDPMDPAAYSQTCPRGKWGDGLEQKGDAKSGVDPTASGPLFQMRPYPSPGAVLRMNKEAPKGGDDDND